MAKLPPQGSGKITIPDDVRYEPPRRENPDRLVFPVSRRHDFVHDKLDRLINRSFFSGESVASFPGAVTTELLSIRAELEEVGPLNLSGQQGTEELAELYWRLKGNASDVVGRRSPAEWVTITRRTRRTPLDHTTLAPRWFLELLTRESTCSVDYAQLEAMPSDPDDRILEDLHHLIMIGSAMWQVGRCYRSVAKGMILSHLLGPTFVGVGVALDRRIAEALLLYDSRGFGGYGTDTERQGSGRQLEATIEELHTPDAVIPGWLNRLDAHIYQGPRRFLDLTTCQPGLLSRAGVFNPTSLSTPPSLSALGAAATLWTAMRTIQGGKKRWIAPRGSWLSWGYLDLPIGDIEAGLARWERVASQYVSTWDPDMVMNEITSTPIAFSNWVTPEPAIVLPAGGIGRVDLIYATRVLSYAVPRQADGPDANVWAERFEHDVQAVIDASPWRPPDSLRHLVGKSIKDGGRTITDIDGIAYNDRLVVLVDAKAWITSADLEYGDFRAVRNHRQAAEQAEASWRKKVATIKAKPSVLKVTLPPNVDIRGIVVCPDVPYVLPGPCTQVIFSSMRSVGTLRELEMAVHQATA